MYGFIKTKSIQSKLYVITHSFLYQLWTVLVGRRHCRQYIQNERDLTSDSDLKILFQLILILNS
jgi:hypothetical protein